ncbi:RadC family protein [Luteimonas huabeiensis]|uniref:RadC family protein n=1 Tax=Luteimonas huabeiensis TaxID=1244513 RepID=UPI0004677582|nr:DNA repair protein RadC [Luteimonas huabeiensis]
MRICDWPKSERPREKIMKHGASVLSDAELLAVFIGSGVNGEDALATGRGILRRHGSLRAVLERSPPQLMRLPGIGLARASCIAAALELGKRYLDDDLKRGDWMSDPSSAGRYFAQRLRHRPREIFAALFLDTRNRAIQFEELFHGTIDSTEVHLREVVRRGLRHNAAAVIVGHNHPSGNPEPSLADRRVTAHLKQALKLVDIRLLDHFIVGDGPPVSMAARGEL